MKLSCVHDLAAAARELEEATRQSAVIQSQSGLAWPSTAFPVCHYTASHAGHRKHMATHLTPRAVCLQPLWCSGPPRARQPPRSPTVGLCSRQQHGPSCHLRAPGLARSPPTLSSRRPVPPRLACGLRRASCHSCRQCEPAADRLCGQICTALPWAARCMSDVVRACYPGVP